MRLSPGALRIPDGGKLRHPLCELLLQLRKASRLCVRGIAQFCLDVPDQLRGKQFLSACIQVKVRIIEPLRIQKAVSRVSQYRKIQFLRQLLLIENDLLFRRSFGQRCRVHRREVIPDRCPLLLYGLRVGIHRPKPLLPVHVLIKPDRRIRIHPARHAVQSAESIFDIPQSVKGLPVIHRIRRDATLQKRPEFVHGKRRHGGQNGPQAVFLQEICHQGEIPIGCLPQKLRPQILGKRLFLLLRHPDHQIALPDIFQRQISRHTGSQAGVHAKVQRGVGNPVLVRVRYFSLFRLKSL